MLNNANQLIPRCSTSNKFQSGSLIIVSINFITSDNDTYTCTWSRGSPVLNNYYSNSIQNKTSGLLIRCSRQVNAQ